MAFNFSNEISVVLETFRRIEINIFLIKMVRFRGFKDFKRAFCENINIVE